jgi:D-3-phosphoglycerate dehydrogenase / 2-oxoglutarate reductase
MLPRAWTEYDIHPDAHALLDGVCALTISDARDDAGRLEELAACAPTVAFIGPLRCDAAMMDRAGPQLKALIRFGIGVDRIDLAAASARGIAVINTPDGPTESTAEHAIALMLALAKGIGVSDRHLHAGGSFGLRTQMAPGLELEGATLGLVGLGRIGRRVAQIAGALGMRVLGVDPLLDAGQARALGVEPTDLQTLLTQSDVVSLHAPAIPATHHLINAEALALMKPGSYLINVARGELVDEAALLEALRSGHLAGAGLDVFDPEPPDPENPLLREPSAIVTPHIASFTRASMRRMQVMAAEQAALLLRGQRPPNIVNALP